jgi:hypothetical protein
MRRGPACGASRHRPQIGSGYRFREPFGQGPQRPVEPDVLGHALDRPGGDAPARRDPASVPAPQQVLLHSAAIVHRSVMPRARRGPAVARGSLPGDPSTTGRSSLTPRRPPWIYPRKGGRPVDGVGRRAAEDEVPAPVGATGVRQVLGAEHRTSLGVVGHDVVEQLVMPPGDSGPHRDRGIARIALVL